MAERTWETPAMNAKVRWLWMAVFLLMAISRAATATVVTFGFSGYIDLVHDTQGLVDYTVHVGDPFSGNVTFDASVSDRNPDPRYGFYTRPITSFSATVGEVMAIGAGHSNRIFVGNDWPVPPGSDVVHDFLHVFAIPHQFLEEVPAYARLELEDFNATVFQSDSLPVSPPPLSEFELATFTIADDINSLRIRGIVTSLTPEPSTLPLLAVGGVALFRRRRFSRSR
jgi:hypothetical protein